MHWKFVWWLYCRIVVISTWTHLVDRHANSHIHEFIYSFSILHYTYTEVSEFFLQDKTFHRKTCASVHTLYFLLLRKKVNFWWFVLEKCLNLMTGLARIGNLLNTVRSSVTIRSHCQALPLSAFHWFSFSAVRWHCVLDYVVMLRWLLINHWSSLTKVEYNRKSFSLESFHKSSRKS